MVEKVRGHNSPLVSNWLVELSCTKYKVDRTAQYGGHDVRGQIPDVLWYLY